MHNVLKKILYSLIVLILFVFQFNFIAPVKEALAQTAPPINSCTANTAACHPEWAQAKSVCNPNSFDPNTNSCNITINNGQVVDIAVCSDTNNTGTCRPARVNGASAQDEVQTVMALAQARGYTATCTAQALGLGGGIDPTTGLGYYYNNTCTVNGLSGVSADILAQNTTTVWNVLATDIARNNAYLASGDPTKLPTGCISGEKFSIATGQPCKPGTVATTPPPTTTTPPPTGTSTNTGTSTQNISDANNTWYYRDPYVSNPLDEALQAVPISKMSATQVAALQATASGNPADPTTGCTGFESDAKCHPEWSIPGSTCTSVASSGGCVPTRVNPYAAAGVARKAEAQGTLKGYATFCSAKYVPFRPSTDPSTGLPYYYDIQCNLNGVDGVDPLSIPALPTSTNAPKSNTNTSVVVSTVNVNGSLPPCSLTATCGVSSGGGVNNNPPAITPPPVIDNTPVPVCDLNNLCTGNIATGLGTFRYVRIDITENSWVSWREIEVYDTKGNKLNISKATASATYQGNWQSPAIPPQVASFAIDGNVDTSWGAGETNPACNQGTYASSCVNSPRSAYITVDLGSAKNIGQIKVLKNGDVRTQVTTFSGSTNGTTFKNIAKFSAPVSNKEWMSYPYTPDSNLAGPLFAINLRQVHTDQPTDNDKNFVEASALVPDSTGNLEVTIPSSVNVLTPPGSSLNTSVWYGYIWKAINADYIKVDKTVTTDANLGTQTSDEASYCATTLPNQDPLIFPNIWNLGGAKDLSQVILLSGDMIMPPGAGLETTSFYASSCNIGKVYKTTFTAYNVSSGKSATFTATVKVSR